MTARGTAMHLFPRIPLFSGYLQSGWRDINKTQKVDAIEGEAGFSRARDLVEIDRAVSEIVLR